MVAASAFRTVGTFEFARFRDNGKRAAIAASRSVARVLQSASAPWILRLAQCRLLSGFWNSASSTTTSPIGLSPWFNYSSPPNPSAKQIQDCARFDRPSATNKTWRDVEKGRPPRREQAFGNESLTHSCFASWGYLARLAPRTSGRLPPTR